MNNCIALSLVLCQYLCFLIPIWKVTAKYLFSSNSLYQEGPYFLVQTWYKYLFFFFASFFSSSLGLLRASILLKYSYPKKMTWHKKGFFIISYSILHLFLLLKITNWKNWIHDFSAEFISGNCQLFACFCDTSDCPGTLIAHFMLLCKCFI